MIPRFSLPGLELARFRRATITRLALVAVVVVPLIYGGLYLWSNSDPVSRLSNLQAAVVNSDTAATVTGVDGSPRTVQAGQDLVTELTGPDAAAGFSWHATSEARAAKGLADGEYAAVLRIPKGFSAALASTGGDAPQQAKLSVTTDDAENYILGQVTNTIATTIRTKVAAGATTDYLENVYVAFSKVHDSLGQAADGAGQLKDGATRAGEGADSLVVGLGDLGTGAQRLATGTGQLRTGAADLASGTARLATGADSAAAGAGQLSTGLGRLRTATKDLPSQTAQLSDGAAQVAHGAGQVSAGAAAVSAAADRLLPAVSAAQDLGPLVDQLLTQTRALAAANPGDANLAQAVTTLQEAQQALADGSAAGVATQVRQQVGALATGAQQLSDGASAVSGGAKQLADAAPALQQGIASAADGAATLATGTRTLATGAHSAADGAAALSAGAARVDDGATSLATGTTRAQTGASQLADGTKQLADGAGTLQTQLADGSQQVPDYGEEGTARAGVVASPVAADRVKENAVPRYSDGLAPLFVPVALWVGGMVTYMVLRAVSQRALASTASSYRAAVAGWVPGALLGVAQAVVLWLVLFLAVGIASPNPVATVLFAALVAVVFTAIHQCLNALLGGVGRLVALVLLVLQLTSAGGTYPVGTSPDFFGGLHPFLPMSYAVDGLRHLVTGAPAGPVWTDVAVLLGFGVLALGVTVLACHRRRTWTVAELHPSLSL
ncbi:YhgE/Pip family protein [Kineococcus rhizosphaerae]|uniref:Putative membrane protein n=1 Tax=Kineococcus rhizosphaerae TaxID=559628 RepID=A0A2T0R245_9ACTN|nr:YhgE/Pip domain-containing protein [Kineococcus rhizosphaerae]PRY13889.1 putative membrane protein [Kineococcus rhizosphaerae]